MVYKIGIVGSDNSHAITFSQIANGVDQANHVPGFEATHLFGFDETRNKEVADKGRIPKVVGDPSEMMGEIDIAFVVFRHGGMHLRYARPFIEGGIPVFVDKPITVTTSDARSLVHLAKDKGIPFTSFSTLRFTGTVQEAKRTFEAEEPIFLSVLGPGDLESEYGGLMFYGIHLSEIMNEIVGHGVEQVMARRKGKSMVADVFHEKVMGTMRVSPEMPYVFSVEAVTRKSHQSKKVDTETCYRDGMTKIKQMLDRKEWPLREGDMFEPVAVVKAIEDSIASGRTVEVERL